MEVRLRSIAESRNAAKGVEISIGMPLFNCEKTVALSIHSILNQTFKCWELIVIDDGSRDRTLKIARAIDDSRIRVVDGRQNLGLPTRLNQAVQLSRGKYFARMDGDDIAYPERLAKQLSFLEQHADVDLLATSMSVFNNQASLLGVRRMPATHDAICAHPWSGFPMAHPTWMGKLDWFRVNPYRSDAVRMEDAELLFRTHSSSKFAGLDEILLGYREGSLSFGKNSIARRNFVRILWQASGKQCTSRTALRGTLSQVARSVMDALALTSGLGYRLLKHRARPASQRELTQWDAVWQRTTSSVIQRTG
jgi:glycosyltransferase involved in cell wall biosynthesis